MPLAYFRRLTTCKAAAIVRPLTSRWAPRIDTDSAVSSE
jgi:hypothetical protein